MLKDPFNEQTFVHKKLIFFTLQSNVILHSRMVNIALFYIHDYSHYVNVGLLMSLRIIGLT